MALKPPREKGQRPNSTQPDTSQFAEALEFARVKIVKYDPSKQRPVSTDSTTMNIEKFCKMMLERLDVEAVNFPEVFKLLLQPAIAAEMLEVYAKEIGVLKRTKGDISVNDLPPGMQDLTLNFNVAAKGRDDKFFLTHSDETVSIISGESYLTLLQLSPLEAATQARKVVPLYLPRRRRGVSTYNLDGKEEIVFNIYRPPTWKGHLAWSNLPDKLPNLFEKLVVHLIPDPIEREYFYSWLYHSLFIRAYTFLILCGVPGTGKNRLKLVMRALHGHVNTVDGKKSTLTERFNSQVSENTLVWFDELSFDAKMENGMKELQNDSISIERKGIDATRATRIHASIVISNNNPRDNYITFNSRKFVPLCLSNDRLEESMASEEIDTLTKKVEDASANTFDPQFLAQIAKWIKRRGFSKKWPNLEYRGPMFWSLAHTSMTQWQKRAVTTLLGPDSRESHSGWNERKGAFAWSKIQKNILRKGECRHLKFPDYSTTQAFFEIFRDSKGRRTFTTESSPAPNILGDFWVKPLFKKTEVITESSIAERRENAHAKVKGEYYDL